MCNADAAAQTTIGYLHRTVCESHGIHGAFIYARPALGAVGLDSRFPADTVNTFTKNFWNLLLLIPSF